MCRDDSICVAPGAIWAHSASDDELCVLCAIEAVLKTKKSMDKMKATGIGEPPIVKIVLSRIQQVCHVHNASSSTADNV
jgi:hypothetical protein